MEFQIRECKISDDGAIYGLDCDEMGYEYPLESTRAKLKCVLKSKKDRVFVATVDDIVVGYVHACDYDLLYEPHLKNIMGIAVLSEYKQQGIGKALLTEIEKWAQSTGAAGVRLASGETRKGAHEFYRRCGYHAVRSQLNFKKYF